MTVMSAMLASCKKQMFRVPKGLRRPGAAQVSCYASVPWPEGAWTPARQSIRRGSVVRRIAGRGDSAS
ncbi:hypothetical protein V6C16_05110, partial [Desulfovibrio sp. 1188_IL3213]